ncbi:MAG: OmpA family protein [Bernardetiaceae bacterium]|nr:OmpA family protein [Bernardetiaceae bacterium]
MRKSLAAKALLVVGVNLTLRLAQAQEVKISQHLLPEGQVVNALTVDNNNVKWAVSEKGLYKLVQANFEKVNLAQNGQNVPASAVMYDNIGRLWVGTYNSKLLQVSTQGKLAEVGLELTGSSIVTALGTDGSEKIWAGTLNNGLFLWHQTEQKLTHYSKAETKFPDDRITTLFTDSRGSNWVGTQSGLWGLEDGQPAQPTALKNHVQAITEHNNSLWATTLGQQGAELWQFEKFKTWKKTSLPAQLGRSKIVGIVFDAADRCWLVADKVACLDKGKWKVYGPAEGYTSAAALCATADRQGHIWVGTEGKGVFQFAFEVPKPAPAPNGLRADNLGQAITLNIQFEQSKADLLASSLTELDNLAQFLRENPSLAVEISGHTDNTGDAKKNQELSEQRAEEVMRYLVAKNIAARRLRTAGYGGSRPVADNRDPRQRERNRRVEIVLKKAD